MTRPYIICHMTTSIDEKVTGDFLSAPECQQPIEEYDRINREFHADAFDRLGQLSWKTSKNIDENPDYGNAHIIEVLCEDTPDASLVFYQSIRFLHFCWKNRTGSTSGTGIAVQIIRDSNTSSGGRQHSERCIPAGGCDR